MTIAPYSGLTTNEISNRMMSDLVILEGSLKLFKNPDLIHVEEITSMKLLLSNINGFDLEIRTNEGLVLGEAFNVAPSFLNQKLYNTRKKIEKEKDSGDVFAKAVIIYNDDALDGKNKPHLLDKQS